MHHYYKKAFISCLLVLIVYAACRKADHPASSAEYIDPATRFFNGSQPANDLVQGIRAFALRENEQKQFVPALVKQIGYPQWGNAITIAAASPGKSGRTGADSVQITYIPFVRDSQQHVNATLAVATSPGDTSLRIFCDWQYSDTAATGLSKAQFALTMMALDKAVFGNRLYRLTDSTIFGQSSRYIRLRNTTAANKTPRTQRSSLLTYIYSYTICWTEYVPLHAGQVVGCEPGPECPFYTEEENCIEISWSSDPSGGGPISGPIGGTGGGGGTGSGGGWIPPNNPNPCGGGVAARTQIQEGCGVGWVPAGGGGGVVAPPVDSMLNNYVKVFLKTGDSIYRNHSTPGNKEYFILGAKKRSTGDTALLNIKTDNDSTAVRPNLNAVGYMILFFWHSHVSKSINPADRRSFSPDDIWTMGFPACLKQNFVSFAYCGNKIYALVITDLSKATAFFNSTDRARIMDAYTTVGSGDMQQIDERCVKNVIGSLAQNGIGFYVSTNSPLFTTWTLLN